MATESILHNFILSKPESIEKFTQIIENNKSSSIMEPIDDSYGKELTDKEEIQAFMERFKKYER